MWQVSEAKIYLFAQLNRSCYQDIAAVLYQEPVHARQPTWQNKIRSRDLHLKALNRGVLLKPY